jgi:hypothetical protein
VSSPLVQPARPVLVPLHPGFGQQRRPWLTPKRKAVLLFGVTVGIVGALLLYALAGREEIDEALCRRGQPPAAHVLFLLDPTDPFSANEMGTVQQLITHEVATLPRGGRLSLLALLPQPGQEAQVLFSRCRPLYDGTNGSALFRNKERDTRVYRELFEHPLAQAIGAVGSVKEAAKTSPLVAALHHIAFMPAFMTSPHRVLRIVSDGLEHTDHTLSHYQKQQYSFEKLKGSVYVREGMFSGVDVRLIQRTNDAAKPYQGPRHEQFWRDYFVYTGAVFRKNWF